MVIIGKQIVFAALISRMIVFFIDEIICLCHVLPTWLLHNHCVLDQHCAPMLYAIAHNINSGIIYTFVERQDKYKIKWQPFI